jgi:hypothetical protein
MNDKEFEENLEVGDVSCSNGKCDLWRRHHDWENITSKGLVEQSDLSW